MGTNTHPCSNPADIPPIELFRPEGPPRTRPVVSIYVVQKLSMHGTLTPLTHESDLRSYEEAKTQTIGKASYW